MSAIAKVGKFNVVPSGYRMINQNTLQKVRRSRKKRRKSYKPKFAVPVLSFAAMAPSTLSALNRANGFGGIMSTKGLTAAGVDLVESFTGVSYGIGSGSVKFNAGSLLRGAAPVAAVGLLSKFGIFRSTNSKLARYRIPLRLS